MHLIWVVLFFNINYYMRKESLSLKDQSRVWFEIS